MCKASVTLTYTVTTESLADSFVLAREMRQTSGLTPSYVHVDNKLIAYDEKDAVRVISGLMTQEKYISKHSRIPDV